MTQLQNASSGVQVDETAYSITLDRSRAFGGLIALVKYKIALLKLDSVSSDITLKHFPIEWKEGVIGKERVEVALFHLHEEHRIRKIVEEIDCRGFKPASIIELLALDAAHPELYKIPIAALGSTWCNPDGFLVSPYLYDEADHRCLALRSFSPGDKMSERWYYLAVRKQ